MVLYVITLVPLVEEIQAAHPGLLIRFYADATEFYGSTRCSAQLIKLIMKRGTGQGYLPKPAKSLFIVDLPDQKEVAKRKFKAEGLHLNFVGGSRYMGGYLGPRKELDALVQPQVEE